MRLLLSVFGQSLLCGLLFLASLLITVVPEAQDRHATVMGVLGVLTLLGGVISVLLILAYARDRERPIFKRSSVFLASLGPVAALLGLWTFGILIG